MKLNAGDIIYEYTYNPKYNTISTTRHIIKSTTESTDSSTNSINLMEIGDYGLTMDISCDKINVVNKNSFFTECQRDNEEIKVVFISGLSNQIIGETDKKIIKLLENSIVKLRK